MVNKIQNVFTSGLSACRKTFLSLIVFINDFRKIIIKRKKFNGEDFAERVLYYVSKKNYSETKYVNIEKDVNTYLEEIDHFEKELENFLISNQVEYPVIKRITGNIESYANCIKRNNSLNNSRINSLNDLLLEILENYKLKKFSLIEDQLVLVMQIYGLSRGNPVVGMKDFKSNTAWKNGSIDGYPFIILLDTLRTYKLTSIAHLTGLYLKSCDHKIILADCAYNFLLQGNSRHSIIIFTFLLQKIFNNAELENLWLDSYKSIALLFETGGHAKKINSDIDEANISKYKVTKKICVSGMGWSGSGALYDFLKEFHNIKSVDGEFQHISGVTSIKTIRGCEDNYDLWRKEVLRFFGLTLFGFAKYSNYQEYRSLLTANRFTLSENKHIYARGANDFCKVILSSYSEKGINVNKLKLSINILLNAIAGLESSSNSNSILMFDNIVKLHRLKEIDYMDDTTILCTYRDPRSNYVALYYENLKIKKNVKDFIKEYKTKRQQAKKEYTKAINKDSVINVQFEEFVSSEEYRNNLAERISIDLTAQNKHKYFQPWISQKNIYNYKEFPDQQAIRLIEKELSEYLWEK
jgi:hypothetical protein